jgi:hypothetical protein
MATPTIADYLKYANVLITRRNGNCYIISERPAIWP